MLALTLAMAGSAVSAPSASAAPSCDWGADWYLDNAADRLYVRYKASCSTRIGTLQVWGHTTRNGYVVCENSATNWNAYSVYTNYCPVYDPPAYDRFVFHTEGKADGVWFAPRDQVYYHS